jgi:hypothetical protein
MDSDNPLDPAGDPFGPPALSTLVACLHCGQDYDSYRIEWRIETDADGKLHGFWCCPIAGCGGMGFGFDIFPVDPEYRDEHGELMWVSDDEDEDADGDELFLEDVIGRAADESRRSTTDDVDDPLPW